MHPRRARLSQAGMPATKTCLNSNPSLLNLGRTAGEDDLVPRAPGERAPALTVRVGHVFALRVSVLPRNRACNSRTCRCSWQTQRRFKGSLTRL